MSYPKMTIKVKLSGKNRVEFDLIQVTDIYLKSGTLMSFGRSIYLSNDWMIYVGNRFVINKTHKIMSIPTKINHSKTSVIFNNEEERYDYLKSFHQALLEWSGNIVFKNKMVFKNNPEIKYHDNIWIIF